VPIVSSAVSLDERLQATLANSGGARRGEVIGRTITSGTGSAAAHADDVATSS